MIEILGRTMRLVFKPPEPVAAPETSGPAPVSSEIEFSAWAADCRLSGTLDLDGERLSDMLNLYDELVLVDVLAQAHDGGRITAIPELAISRDEILLVEASGPRGDPTRRRHLRAVPISVQLDDFLVRGDVHVSPGADPILALGRRPPMIALTDAQIMYRGEVQRLSDPAHATILFNWHLMTGIDVAKHYVPQLTGVA
jgi:hypothetical protein